MAGNSVPAFFGAKARTKKPPGLDITSVTDLSGSMQAYASFISSRATLLALEQALLAQGIGDLSPNRYSLVSGAGRSPAYATLAEIERFITVDGSSQRWATGASLIDASAIIPILTANLGVNTEDMGLAAGLMSENDRDYLGANERIIIAGSNEQSAYASAFVASPTYNYRYVGVHSVTLSISEPAGPNSVPSGTLSGFVYTTNTTGVAIYIDGSTINYRTAVPVANVTATATNGTKQINVDHAATTNGAIYSIAMDFELLGESLGNVLGEYHYDIS